MDKSRRSNTARVSIAGCNNRRSLQVEVLLVGFDIAEWTVKVLTEGLPPLPTTLERSQTVPLAYWKRGRYGAVLFVRRWRNDQMDSDCAITTLGLDDRWEQPSGWGGGGWIDNPLVRPETGWDGEPVVWMGSSGTEFEDVDGNTVAIHAVEGAAARTVATIDVQDGDDRYDYRITSPGGAFVIGVLHEDATLTPRTDTGDVVNDSSGAPIVHVERAHSAPFPWLDPDVKSAGSGGITGRGVWAVTVGSNVRGFAVDLTDDGDDEDGDDEDDNPDATYGRGTVKFFLEHKGWGGITCPELDADVWVHFSAIDQPGGGYRVLTEGQTVEFRCIPIRRGSWQYEASWVRALPASE